MSTFSLKPKVRRCLCHVRCVRARDRPIILPTYSPNLNLIERLWKFVRKECLYAKYYEHFELFKRAIEGCLSETTGRHKLALNSLLTLEFQTFQSATFAL